ncbi:RCC1/BLIP-II protein [Fragilariopsis cylindrus CCMP1102]|uniref:RCC1/BLIP-II protein n=1 Tax=Fragilariopsis cylindrus CCMP1102 TaxID=635003 RepID=A0A1E7EVW1_9STRA|nr:RCC1/BLIP-II protein [Fragilariopsis cylindrus CCMP1102]|eukprot:OEU09935.1 RCC1/BLIP-II protein [Fragilariopsis cylindrus CCMP1102]
MKSPLFVDVAKGTQHSIGITNDGTVFSWGRSSSMGKLGRDNTETSFTIPGSVPFPSDDIKVIKAFASTSSDSDSGHSAIIDDKGRLWMAGCDRWQQLGLGSSNGGSTGYTWKGGKQWQDRFLVSQSVTELMNKDNDDCSGIRDVALGGDHTLVLSSDKESVYAYGKGGDGQLGFVGKPFVSAPKRSPNLSGKNIAAVCAIQSCSMTIDDNGEIKNKVGKCRSSLISDGIMRCIENARQHGLILDKTIVN